MQTHLSWEAQEYKQKQRTTDWYIAVWIIVISIAVIAVLYNDLLLAVLILLSAFTLTSIARRPPQILKYSINEQGVVIDDSLYPYESLDSFGFDLGINAHARLLLKSKKTFLPLFVIPLNDEVNMDDVREILKTHLSEERHTLPLAQKLLEYLGF